MAERPCRLRLQGCLLSALLMSSAMTAHAVGIAVPQVMSGLNEPLKARVALLDTGALRADDLRVALADSARWQAMKIARSADTDTLRLAVNGTPGHLYLDIQGSRALGTPWLDVVLTLSWPEGELTPQLTLLPSTDAVTGEKTTVSAVTPALEQTARSNAPVPGDTSRGQSVDRQTRVSETSAQNSQRMAVLEDRLDRLEQQLRASLETQTALTTDLESVRAQSLVNQAPDDAAEMQALAQRQQVLESRLDQLDQQRPAIGIEASSGVSRFDVPLQQTSSQSLAPALDHGAGRNGDFIWTWALAALLLMLAGTWAGIRRWRQRRYRLVSAAELSPLTGSASSIGSVFSADEEGGNAHETGIIRPEQNEAWTAHRAQVEAICVEAEVFHRHGRREHAITMLKEGLAHYPSDFQLIQALAALEAASDNDETHDGHDDQLRSTAPISVLEDSPALAPVWSLQSSPSQEETVETVQRTAPDSMTGQRMNFSTASTAGFPRDWALEEVAFEGADTDNEHPDADRLSRRA